MVTAGKDMESISTFKDMYGIFNCVNQRSEDNLLNSRLGQSLSNERINIDNDQTLDPQNSYTSNNMVPSQSGYTSTKKGSLFQRTNLGRLHPKKKSL